MGCTILVSVLLSPLPSLTHSWLQTGEDLDNNQKLGCIIANLGTSSGKSLTMCLNLLLDHGQKSRQRTQAEQYIDWESLCWGLWFLKSVCTPVILLTFNIYKKAVWFTGAELFYEAWLRLEVLPNNKQVLRQQLDSCRRGECDSGTNSFILLIHLIKKELTVFYPRVNTIYWITPCDWTDCILDTAVFPKFLLSLSVAPLSVFLYTFLPLLL